MSWFSNLFTSPRERAAPGLYQGQMNEYSNLLNQAAGLQTPYAGVNANNVNQTFGMTPFDVGSYQKDVANAYSPLYRNLATSAAKSRQSAANAQSSTNATPALQFNPIDSSYAGALGNLQSSQAQEGLQGYNMQQQQQEFTANLLNSVFGNEQNFGLQKLGMQTNIAGQKGNSINDYLSSLSDTSTFGDLLAGFGAAGQIAMPFLTGGLSIPGQTASYAKSKAVPAAGGYGLT